MTISTHMTFSETSLDRCPTEVSVAIGLPRNPILAGLLMEAVNRGATTQSVKYSAAEYISDAALWHYAMIREWSNEEEARAWIGLVEKLSINPVVRSEIIVT